MMVTDRAFDLMGHQRFLNNAIFCVRAGGLFVFLFWNAEAGR